MLFGLRQYSGGGWLGVMPDSNLAYYTAQLAQTFGWAALVLLLLAPLLLRKGARRRLRWLLPFPLLYLILMVGMNMVVRRNLAPVVPLLAAFAGVAFSGLVARAQPWLQARRPRARLVVVAVASCLLLAAPIYATTLDTIAFARHSTLELADAWIEQHVPRGASILKEQYTPRLDPSRHRLRQARFAPRVPLEEMQDGNYDFLLLASRAYARYLYLDPQEEAHHQVLAARYLEIFATWERIATFEPGRLRHGSQVDLFRIPWSSTLDLPTTLRPETALVGDATMVVAGALRFDSPGQWASFRAPLPAGTHHVQARGAMTEGGSLRVVAPSGGLIASSTRPQQWCDFELPAPAAVLLDLVLAPGSTLRAIAIESVQQTPSESPGQPPAADGRTTRHQHL
jgi:hypothetical protein